MPAVACPNPACRRRIEVTSSGSLDCPACGTAVPVPLATADTLDITWLRDENATNAADLPPPDEIAARITTRLKTALTEMEKLTVELDSDCCFRNFLCLSRWQ